MTREDVMQVVVKHIVANVDGLEPGEIDPSKSMLDLGASSLDIVEIVSASMRELRVAVQRTELIKLKNIDQLVDLLLVVQNAGAGQSRTPV
jgi:polyketide biosynthesis acyl carrier protein